MKTFFTLFIFSLLAFSSQAQWVELDTGIENPPYFYDVYAITPETVVVVGASGTILKTTDGGETWQQKTSGTTSNLSKILFATTDIGYIVGGNGTFLKTTDGGETWIPKDIGQTFALHGLSCVDENIIYISAYENYIMKSEDGGDSWIALPIELDNIDLIQFFENGIGYVHTRFGEVLKTENGGETWEELTAFPHFQFLDENVGYFYSDGLYKTIDGGNNFVQTSDGSWGESKDIFIINEDNIWGLFSLELLNWGDPQYGIIKVSRHQSEQYEESVVIMNLPEYDLFSIHFADENIGYVVGIHNGLGSIWKNGTGINTMKISENELIDNIKVYPNPALNELNITFEKPVTADISLTDITGKQVYTNSLQEKDIKISTTEFPKGIYILSIKTVNKNLTKKIIIN